MALAELRNISSTSYFRSATSLLPVLGGDATFTASVLLRELGPTSATQWICGNVNAAGTAGWSFVRLSDSSSGATHNYTFTVYEAGAAQALTFAVRGSIGKMMLFHLVYTGTTQTVYVNGIEVVTAATAADPISASTGRFSIGYNFNGSANPNPDMGFVAFGYGNVAFTASEIAENTLSIIKSQEISSSGLPTPLTNIYSVARDSGSGVPSTLRNFGTTTIALEVLGRTSLSLSSPPSFLGDSALITSSGGGGDVSGPGASTNNAVATWDGVNGDALLNTVVTIAPVSGNIATPGTVDGRDISVDGAKLDTIATGATNTPLSAVAPVNVTKAAAAVGVAVTAARSDHKHDVTTAAANTITVGAAAAEGVSASLARADHTHAVTAPAAPVNVTKAAASAGAAVTVARSDHKHDVTTAVAVSVTSATNAEGVATSLARSDHTHAHGNLLGGTLHAVATDSTAGFMSAADKTKLDSIPGSGSTISDIYVSAANGNDANAGDDPGAAVATLARAMELVPTLPTSAVVVHIGSGSYTWADLTAVKQGSNAPFYIWGDGAGQPGDDGFSVVDSGTAGIGSTAINVLDTFASDNQWAGYTLEFTSGALVGQRRTVRNNSTTAIVPCAAFSAAPTPGDTFNVLQSDVILVNLQEGANIGTGIGFSQVESPLVLINLRLQGSNFETAWRMSSTRALLYGVALDEGGLTCVDSTIHAGTLYTNAGDNFGSFGNFLPFQGTNDPLSYMSIQLALIAPSIYDWQGWGLSTLRDTDQQIPLVMDSGIFSGYLVGSQLTVSPAAKVALVGGSIIDNGQTTSGVVINNGGYLNFQNTTTQRTAAGALTLPGVPFYLLTGSGGKLGLQTVQGGYTEIDTLTFNTANDSISIFVADTGVLYASGEGAGLVNVGGVNLQGNATALFEGVLTTVGTQDLFVSTYSTCVFDGPSGTWDDITVLLGSTLFVGSNTTLTADDFSVTYNSTVHLLSYFDINGDLLLTDSTMFVQKTGALATTDLGATVTLTNSELNIDAYPNTVRVNNGGSATATVFAMSNSTFRQNGFPLTITGRVAMTAKSSWLGGGNIGATTASRVDCFSNSDITITGVTGSLSFIDTSAPSFELIASRFQFSGTALTIGNSVNAEWLIQDGAEALVTTTGAVLVAGSITCDDSAMSINDGTTFTVNRSVTLDNSRLIMRSINTTISTGFIGRNCDVLQSACTVNINSGVDLLHGSKWTARGALGGTSTWDGQTDSGLTLSSNSIFDMTGVTDAGSFVFDANATLTPVVITSNAGANFLSANIDITGSPTLAAMSLTFGGHAYFTGALTGFTATGDDFDLDGDSATFTDVNTYFTTIPGGPLSRFATPGSPSIVQFTAFVMRIS